MNKRGAIIIDKDAISHNSRLVKQMIGEGTRLMSVVKANGYGHGMIESATATLAGGADWLGVASVKEGCVLRAAGITSPILALGALWQEEMAAAITNDISMTIFSTEVAKRLSQTAQKLNKTAKVHVKLDTGMGRLGLSAWAEDVESSLNAIRGIAACSHVCIEGLYSHFASSESDSIYSHEQYGRFAHIIAHMDSIGLHIPIIHISNSGAILNYRAFDHDMVRSGILIYGLSPESSIDGANKLEALGFRPALSLYGGISHIKTMPSGRGISYGRTFTTERPTTIATIPLGYADGIPRLLSNRGRAIVRGEYAPIVGAVCMNQVMLDISHIPKAELGDKAYFIGQEGGCKLRAEDIAALSSTINYEVICALAASVDRI